MLDGISRAQCPPPRERSRGDTMTGDQRLILKIEQAVAAVERDQLLAAYHVLDEILVELETQTREAVRNPALDRRERPRTPVVAAG